MVLQRTLQPGSRLACQAGGSWWATGCLALQLTPSAPHSLCAQACGREEDCLATYRTLEKTHPLPAIRRQAADLRYIMEAPKLQVGGCDTSLAELSFVAISQAYWGTCDVSLRRPSCGWAVRSCNCECQVKSAVLRCPFVGPLDRPLRCCPFPPAHAGIHLSPCPEQPAPAAALLPADQP